MNREKAEKLLAALIFDDLDEPSKAELLANLQTDDELRERLTDMRMAVKLAGDAVNDGPAPVLSEHRLAELRCLSTGKKNAKRVFSIRPLWYVAAVLAIGLVFMGLAVPSLNKVRRYSVAQSPSLGLSGGAAASSQVVVEESRSLGFATGADLDKDPRVPTDRMGGFAGGQVDSSGPFGGIGGG